jgi:hypothetical protein
MYISRRVQEAEKENHNPGADAGVVNIVISQGQIILTTK